ncbi:MAG: condensation domain-containing protein, partial [Terriglobales bacterium]
MTAAQYHLQTDVTTSLRGIIADAMQISPEDLSIDEPLTDMGVSSLVLVDALRRVQETFGVRPSARRILEQYPTVAACAEHIAELMREKPALNANGGNLPSDAEAHSIFSGPVERLPLLALQKQIGFLAYLTETAAAAFRENLMLSMSGPLDVAALKDALAGVIDRHGALRTRLIIEESAQEIAAGADHQLAIQDVAGANATDAQRAASAWLAARAKSYTDANGPALGVALIGLQQDLHLLFLSAHAGISDRPGLNAIAHELGALYSAGLKRTAATLPDVSDYKQYLEQSQYAERPEALDASARYWLEQFQDGIPPVELPTDHSRPPTQSYEGRRLIVPLLAPLTGKLRGVCQERGASLYSVALSAFAAVLHRFTGERDLVIGTTGRKSALEPGNPVLIANRTDLLPLRVSVDAEQTFRALLDSIEMQLSGLRHHSDYPFALIVQLLNPKRDLARSPVFSVAFEAESMGRPPQFAGLQAEYVTAPSQHVRYDLHVTLQEIGDAVQLQCDYATDLFESHTARRIMICLRNALAAIADDLA